MARFARPGAAKRPYYHDSIERYFGERSEAIPGILHSLGFFYMCIISHVAYL